MIETNTPRLAAIEARNRAVEMLGGGASLARVLGISRGAVCHWSVIPAKHVWSVERLTGIPASELRPDLAATFAEPAQ